MLLPSDVSLSLAPITSRLPTFPLLQKWMAAGFQEDACLRIFETFAKENSLVDGELIDLSALSKGDLLFTDKLLYPNSNGHWYVGLNKGEKTQSPFRWHAELKARDVRSVADSLRAIFTTGERAEVEKRMALLGVSHPRILTRGSKDESRRQFYPDKNEPGIYRNEHASLSVVSEKAHVMLDPISFSDVGPADISCLQPSPNSVPDAILITHGHRDHFHIPSLLATIRDSDCLVIVPEVSRENYLSLSFSRRLKIAGIKHRAAKWGDVIRVKDIQVKILPFYGEQPARDLRWSKYDIRNSGNCYRITTPHLSVIALADSGSEPAGSMANVLRESAREDGPPNAIAACMREFLSPFEIYGLGGYWIVFTFPELKRLFKLYKEGRLKPTTGGLATQGGLADLCAVARCSYFLPYAQGFSGLGKKMHATEWGPGPRRSELTALKILRSQLNSSGCPTQAVTWNPGDRVQFPNGKVKLFRYAG